MMARRNITDRAHRYRANNLMPAGRKSCAWCGSTRNVVPDHINGVPDDTRRSNLQWLCKSCNTKKGAAFAKAGRGRLTRQYNPAQGVPTFQQYAWAVANHVRGAHDEGGVIIHATPDHKRHEYAQRIAEVKRSRGTDSSLPDWVRNPSARIVVKGVRYDKEQNRTYIDVETPEFRKEYYISGYVPQSQALGYVKARVERELREFSNPAKFDRCVRKVKARGGDVNAYAVCSKSTRRGRKNPAAAAAEVFEEFHGYKPSEVVTVTKKIHHHEHLASAGRLISLDVWGIDNRGHKISGFGKALLAFNEDKNQLFVEGGDQSLNLADFGITRPHEMETLGRVTDIGYHTNKTHLGEDGGEAVYVHKFRSTNKDGRHVVVKIARYPDLIYDVRNEQLLFSGGSYEIRAEGIDR